MGLDTYISRFNNKIFDEFYVRKSYILTDLLEKNSSLIGSNLQWISKEDVNEVIRISQEVGRHRKFGKVLLEEHLFLLELDEIDEEDIDKFVQSGKELKKYYDTSCRSDESQDYLFLLVVK